MISFIKDIFYKATSKIPYLTEKFSSLGSGINNFFLPTSSQDNFDPSEGNMEDDPVSQVKDFTREDINNIFNQQNNKDYLLQDMDIYQILQFKNTPILPILIQDIVEYNKLKAYQQHTASNSWIKSFYNKITSFVERIFLNNKNYDSTKEALVTAIKALSSSPELATCEVEDNSLPKSKHFIVNLERNHWTCLSLVKNEDNLYILYKDSMEILSYNKTQIELYIKNIAQYECKIEKTHIKFIANQTVEQKDSTSCGIFALKNIEIIQQKLLEEDSNNFLENFADSDQFSKADDISKLRTEYAKEYLHSNIKSILMEPNLYPLSKDKLKDTLKENLHTSNNHNLVEQINTYVESYNPNAQLEEAFSNPFYSPIWLLNKNYPLKPYHSLTITGAQDENYQDPCSCTLTQS